MKGAGNRGIVLVAVLLAVAIMSVMVVALTSLTRAGIDSQRLEARLLATHFALRSGLEAAKALILATPAEQRAFFNGEAVALDLGGGITAEVTVRDAAGLADLNRSGMPLIAAVLQARFPEQGGELAARISAWRKPAAAEAAQRPRPPRQTPDTAPGDPAERKEAAADLPVIFQSVDQLQALIEAEGAAEGASAFTVFSPHGLINPLAAPDDVLQVLPGYSRQVSAAVDGARKVRKWKSDQRLTRVLEQLKGVAAVEDPSVFVIGVRLSGGPGVIAGSRASAVVQAAEKGGLPFRTLAVSGL